MNRFIKTIVRRTKQIYIVSLFLIASLLVIYLFPLQGKFRYEYKKGSPWAHEDLVAPFNFAILKSDAELKSERDSVLHQFKPYFDMNESIGVNELKLLNNEFDSRFSEAKRLTLSTNPKYIITDSIKQLCKQTSNKILTSIYNKGVVNFSDVLDNTINGSTIVIIKNNVAENREVNEVFTQKIAYNYIDEQLKKEFPNDNGLIALIDNLKLYDFVKQNLTYNEETSTRVKENLLSSISENRGMIQAGQRIISKGELVYADKFMILESLRTEYQSMLGTKSTVQWLFVGQIVIILISFTILYLFLFHFRHEILESFIKTLFIILMVLTMIIAAIMVLRFDLLNIYMLPFVALPIIIRTFYDSRLAFFIHLVTIMLVGFLAPNAFEFVFLQFIAGAISIFSLTQMHRRGQLFYAVALIFMAYAVTYATIAVMQEGSIIHINFKVFGWFAWNALMLLTCYPLIFIFEKLFGFVSDVTLLELSDTNHPALRLLAEKAPGTFQHVMQVANLSEEAVRRIGGNSLLMRVGALYHDIGKAGAPGFFVENQAGKNPHDGLSYEKSAEVIIHHVLHGVELAKKHKLPQPIIDFILTHHGTGLVKYFYTKYVNENEGRVPDLSAFSYPGPSPFTKETAVLMMADAVEASSRTLKEYNENSIDELVEKIINNQMADHQFDEADITFKDISTVKEVFKQKLMNIYHARIEYPEMK